jgi:uncharacterized membrane-anchored protein
MYVAIGSRNFYLAQDQLKRLAKYERELKKIIDQESFVRADNDRQLYTGLSDISKKVASQIANTRYDFQATLAFSDLVFQRVHELREERVEGWTRTGYFLERTFRPCVRTCQSALNYQRDVSQGVQEAASLLGAGLGLLLEEESVQRANENRAILGRLQSIAETSSEMVARQSRLHLTLELIALVPIVYYATQILEHAEHEGMSLWIKVIIVFVVFMVIRLAGWGLELATRLAARLRGTS